jgi:hypothetical protein
MANKQERRPARGGAVEHDQANDTGEATENQRALAELHLASDTHKVGLGYTVQFTMRAGQLCAYWMPHIPHARDQRRVCAKYETVRLMFAIKIARSTGGPVVLREIEQ